MAANSASATASDSSLSVPAEPLPPCDFSGLWHPGSTTISSASTSKSEMKSWPPLTYGILKLDPKTLETITVKERMRIRHTSTSVTVQHQPENVITSSTMALTLQLDNQPHTFHSGTSLSNQHVFVMTACQLDETESHDLLVKIEFPPTGKKPKFTSFAAEQVALNRSGYILERSHRSSENDMTQVVQYHRAPLSMNDEIAATLDAAQLPVVYLITRTYTRVQEQRKPSAESKEQVEERFNSPSHSPNLSSKPSPTRLESSSTRTPIPSSPSISATTAASSSSPSTSSSSTVTVGPPLRSRVPHCTLTGTWKVDRSKSDTLEGMMKELNVPWIARKLVMSLDVTTHIQHNPEKHECIVVDKSSAGEQATTHQTIGDWKLVSQKEGKIKMCAKEGEEMRHVWDDLGQLPPNHAETLPFTPSDIPFEFPSYLPRPVSPSQKQHPLPYGYLWIHSHLPDIPGGEMQDVRVLLDRTSMMQQTMIIKHKKLTHTTTRYFTKQETPAERLKNEAEWEQKIEEWKRIQYGPSGASLNGEEKENNDSDDEESVSFPRSNSGSSSTNTSNGSISIPPSPSPASFAITGPGPHPNLSGTWSVIKEKSNDLSVLLKRMGIPWIWRAFASTVNIQTHITHTNTELILKDTSKFGSHIQTLKLDGKWSRVTQYGRPQQGLCRVKADPTNQSVTVETVYLAPGKKKLATPTNSAPTSTPASPSRSSANYVPPSSRIHESKEGTIEEEEEGAGSSSRSSRTPSSAQRPPSHLLTMESTNSPGVVSGNLSTDEAIPLHDDPESLALPPPMSLANDDEEGKQFQPPPLPSALSILNETPKGLPPLARTHSLPVESPVLRPIRVPFEDDMVIISAPASPTFSSSQPNSQPNSRPISRPSSTKPHTGNTLLLHSNPNSAPGTPMMVPTPPPTISRQTSSSIAANHVIASHLIDIRVMLAPDLMRQVITYLEYEVVVCVCSRFFRKELSPEEKAAKKLAEKEAKKEAERVKREEKAAQKEAAKAQKEAEAAEKKRIKQLKNEPVVSQPSQSANNMNGHASAAPLSSAPSSSSSSSASSIVNRPSSSSSTVAVSPPVNVVLPSAVAAAAAAEASSAAIPPTLDLSALTPTRAILLFLFLAALASGNHIILLLVLGGCIAYFYIEWKHLHQLTANRSNSPLIPRSASGSSPFPSTATSASSSSSTSSIIRRQVVTDRKGSSASVPPIIPIAPGLQVEVVPLRK